MRISQVLPWLDAHGVAIVSALAAIVAAWKLVPAPTRARIELAFPRVAGVVRSVAAVAPDLVGFARVVWYQVAQGKARGVVPPATPPAPIAPVNIVVNGAITEQQGADLARALREASTRSNARAGFAAVDALAIALGVGALAFTAVALSGCPLPAPDGCTPRDTRCAPDGIPEVCSSTQRWTRGVPAEPCPSAAQCCRTMSPWGRALHACVPATACIPESPVAARDGGAE